MPELFSASQHELPAIFGGGAPSNQRRNDHGSDKAGRDREERERRMGPGKAIPQSPQEAVNSRASL
jgi:hypothetical protein